MGYMYIHVRWRFSQNTLRETKSEIYTPKRDDDRPGLTFSYSQVQQRMKINHLENKFRQSTSDTLSTLEHTLQTSGISCTLGFAENLKLKKENQYPVTSVPLWHHAAAAYEPNSNLP